MAFTPHFWQGAGTSRIAARLFALMCLWLSVAGVGLADTVIGFCTTAAATWASLRLAPPAAGRLRLRPLLRLVLRFLPQSLRAGIDVARRAFAPSLPLRPGFVQYPTSLTTASSRTAFCAFESLLPGTLPAGTDASGAILVHCLDVGQPIQAQLAADEALFAGALRQDRHSWPSS